MAHVYVYIYDLSKGISRQISFQMIGKQIDGIWHSGIVVFDQEISFGSDGIVYTQPKGTLLGTPNTELYIGSTLKTNNELQNYLNNLSVSEFHYSTYKLLYHNCNTFSNQLAKWLTGKEIPEYVINLPKEVLSTPFGCMIQPFIEKYSPTVSAAYVAATSSYNRLKTLKLMPVLFKDPLSFYVAEFLNESHSLLDSKSSNLLVELINNVSNQQMIISNDLDDLIITSLFSESIDIKTKFIVYDVLRLLSIKNHVFISLLVQILPVLTQTLLHSTESNELMNIKCKLICNLIGILSDEKIDINTLITINKFALELLRSRSNELIASSLLRNILGHKTNLDTCLEIGSALIFLDINDIADPTAKENVIECIQYLIQEYVEIKDLAISSDVYQMFNKE